MNPTSHAALSHVLHDATSSIIKQQRELIKKQRAQIEWLQKWASYVHAFVDQVEEKLEYLTILSEHDEGAEDILDLLHPFVLHEGYNFHESELIHEQWVLNDDCDWEELRCPRNSDQLAWQFLALA